MIAYAILGLLSLWFNRRDGKLVLLTLVVGGAFFFDVPRSSQTVFYSTCIAVEIGVAVLALLLRTQASALVAELCAIMVVSHVMAWMIDGHRATSVYKPIMFAAEYTQMLVCLLAAQPVASRLKNHESPLA